MERLLLIQLRKDLEAAADTEDDPAEAERLRKAFVNAALPYSESKGITYSAWREAGVPADVLRSRDHEERDVDGGRKAGRVLTPAPPLPRFGRLRLSPALE
jgi:hypothetical protein